MQRAIARTHLRARTLQPHSLRNAKHCSSLKLNRIRQSSRRDSLRDTLLVISLTRNEFDDGVIVHEIPYDDTNDIRIRTGIISKKDRQRVEPFLLRIPSLQSINIHRAQTCAP